MNPQFEELAQRIADAVEKRFSTRFDEADKRLEGDIGQRLGDAEKRLSKSFADVETRLSKNFADAETRLSKSFADAEKRLSNSFAEAEKRLSDGAKMNLEDLRATVTGVAEGYGATLDRIERQLTELNEKLDTKIGDHDSILTNHAERIAKLEQNKIS